MPPVDTGFTALLILLAVTNEGLGASFFGFDSRTLPGFRAQFGVPAEWMPIGAIAIGHPDPGSDPIQISSEAMEMAIQELRSRLSSGSASDDAEPMSLDAMMSYIRKRTPPA